MYVTGYYPVWSLGTSPAGQANAMYPHEMNWNGLTHVIHFNVQIDQTAPYWHPATSTTLGTPYVDSLELFYAYSWRSNSTTYKMIDSLRTYAHRNGVKLILSIGGTWGPGAAAMDFITSDSGRTTVMAKAVVAFAARNGYDGIETNWEPPGTAAQAARLIRILKREMTRTLGPNADLLVTACPDHCGPDYLSVQDSVQQFLITAYDMKRPSESGLGAPDIVGFDAPLHPPSVTQFPLLNYWNNNYDGLQAGRVNWSGANEMIVRGFSRAKLVQVFPGFAYVFRGNTAPEQATASFQQYLYNIDAQIALSRGGTRRWENSAKVPWITGTATQAIGWQVPQGSPFYITYDDTASIREKVIWSKGLNLGGVGIYELQSAWNASAPQGQKDPLVRVMVNEVNNPPPAPVPTGTFTATPSSLPLGGGTVTLSWTSSNALSASIDQGIGTVALNGSRNVAVTTTTTFRLTLTNAAGNNSYTATVDVALPPPPPPSAPVLTSPANGATGVATRPTLTWSASPGATSYRVQVSTNAGFTTTVVDQSNITATSHVPSSVFTLSTTYYWRVSATNGGGTSPYSSAWSFTTSATAAGPVAAYGFDEGTGTTVGDASGHGLTGTTSGTSWTTQGRYANALSFNGSSSYVDLGNPAQLQITGSMTWSAWIRAAANPVDDGQIIAKSDDNTGWQFKTSPDTGPQTFGVAVSSSGSIRVQRYSTTIRSLNTWYHVAGVYNATAQTLDIYINGVLDNGTLIGTVPASQFDPSLNVNMGRRSGGYYFNGVIDEVRIYNRVLTQAEIQSDMNTPLSGTPPPPPSIPSFVYPAGGATGVPSSFAMLWRKSAGATNYHLQLSADSLFGSQVVNDSTLTDTTRQISGLANGTKFWRRVRAKGAGGWSGFGSPSSFTTTTVALPTGVFSATPDSLPVGGGTVTLNWSSTGADSARIGPGIGAVPLTGSMQIIVGATTTFVLTLSNQAGNTQYVAIVDVSLPGGQGQQDITIQALPPIALITQPTGSGNRNIEIIRDGNTPPVGNSDPNQQYDTFNGGAPRAFDWIGYSFPTQHTFSEVTFQEGMQFSGGGWFTSLTVQVHANGTWTDVQNLQSTPPYAGANSVSYETYQFSFTPVAGDGIRIAGTPGGSAHFMSVGELRVFNNGTTNVPPTPGIPRDFALAQNYPNPFNPSTKIGFDLPVGAEVSLKVYNLLGEEVASLVNGYVGAGLHTIDFSADRLTNGVYFYALKTIKYSEMKKMVLLR